MFYAFKIAPPDLIATTVAVAGVFLWTAGKGAGSFVGGQLTEVLEITEVFFIEKERLDTVCNLLISGRVWSAQ